MWMAVFLVIFDFLKESIEEALPILLYWGKLMKNLKNVKFIWWRDLIIFVGL